MKNYLFSFALAVLLMSPVAHARNVTTPVLSVTDTSGQSQAFHLVSQTPSRTVVQFDDLAIPMHGSYSTSSDYQSVAASASQYFQLSVNPAFELISITLQLDLRLISSGALIADPYLSYSIDLMSDGESRVDREVSMSVGNFSGPVQLFIADSGFPLPQNWNLGIELDASAHGAALPSAPASGSFATDRIFLILQTNQSAPIPEPSSYMMLCAGLLLGALWMRRDRAHRPQLRKPGQRAATCQQPFS